MSLTKQAAADLEAILGDECGFSVKLSLTSPDGECIPIRGLAADVSQLLDPQTGQAISGREVSVALPLKVLKAELGVDLLPKAVSDETAKPWTITVKDVLGTEHRFKIRETRPDRTLGVLVCLLEIFHEEP